MLQLLLLLYTTAHMLRELTCSNVYTIAFIYLFILKMYELEREQI